MVLSKYWSELFGLFKWNSSVSIPKASRRAGKMESFEEQLAENVRKYGHPYKVEGDGSVTVRRRVFLSETLAVSSRQI